MMLIAALSPNVNMIAYARRSRYRHECFLGKRTEGQRDICNKIYNIKPSSLHSIRSLVLLCGIVVSPLALLAVHPNGGNFGLAGILGTKSLPCGPRPRLGRKRLIPSQWVLFFYVQ